jgi:hypothetical protein
VDTRRPRIGHPLVLVVGAALLLAVTLADGAPGPGLRPIGDLVAHARAGSVETITVEGSTLTLALREPAREARVRVHPNADVVALLRVTGVPPEQIERIRVEHRPPPELETLIGRTVQLLPFAVLGAFLFALARQARRPDDHART